MMKYSVMLLLLLPMWGQAEIYRWTDESGRVHFGDAPKDTVQAEKVVVEVNSYEHVELEEMEFFKAPESRRVTMYATSWCGYCKKARRYFQKNNISYVEYDIEKDEKARRMYDMLGGKGVPVILVGKRRMNGFSVGGFERIYK